MLGKEMFKKFWKALRRKFGRVVEPPIEDLDDNIEEQSPTPPRETLDPSKILQREDALSEIKAEADELAGKYTPDMMGGLFQDVAEMFAGLWKEYRELAAAKLETALDAFKSAEMPKGINVDIETEELKAGLRPLAEKRLNTIDALYERVAKATTMFNRLCAGITGNTAILPVVTTFGFEFVLPIIAAVIGSMLFEVVFNAPLLQDKANLDIAQMFSVLVSLAGTMTTFMAGRSMRVFLDHRNAETESNFPDSVDRMTNKPAVFPMAGDAKFERHFWHSAMFFVISATLVIRYIMASQVGDMAGSLGVTFVFVVLYGWEAKYAKVNHPRAKECLAKKAEAELAEAELTALKGDIASPEAKRVFDEYVNTLTAREAAERAKADARKQVANEFVRLANEFTASPQWFAEKFREVLREVVELIGDERTETDEELSALTIGVEPEFSTFDLESELAAVASISTSIEVRGRRMTATEFENFLEKLTDELIKERAAAKLAAAEEEARRAAAKAAMPAPKTSRPQWTPPKLGGRS